MLDNTNDQVAMNRVLKARAELILTRRFYGVLVSNVEPVLSRKFPTMATDGRHHFVNPDFVGTLTQTQLLAIQAHESEHDARKHHSRRGNRDPKKWNEATDFGINADLKAQGFDLPSGCLYDPRFEGMSAEDIYRIRELDEQAAQKQQQQEESKSEEGKTEDETGSDGDGNDSAADQADVGDDEQSSSENDDAGDEADGQGTGEDDEPSEPGSSGSGDGTSDNDNDAGEQAGSGGESDAPGESTLKGSGEGAGEPSDERGSGTPQQSSGDPGRCGEVLDAAEDAAEMAETDQKWDRIVRQAAAMAKGIGQLPGHVTREIERDSNPTQDWREVLRQWVDAGCKRIETWNRPNRRLVSQGYTLPGTQRDGLNKVVCLIDTSGSMDDVALKCINVELQAALDDGAIDQLIAVYGDTVVTRIDSYNEGDEIVFDPRGGGGTDMGPLFKHAADEHDDASLVICFTDMFWDRDGIPEPQCPVLFAVTGYPDSVRQLIANAPWGAAGIDVGAH